LRYAKDEGIGIGKEKMGKEIFALWESGVPLAEAKKKFGLS